MAALVSVAPSSRRPKAHTERAVFGQLGNRSNVIVTRV